MSIVEQARELSELAQRLDNAELLAKVLNLQAEVMKLADAASEKDKRIKELEEHLNFQGRLVRQREVYWQKDEKGKPTGDPYCSYCWETARLAVHLIDRSCPHCKTMYTALPSNY